MSAFRVSNAMSSSSLCQPSMFYYSCFYCIAASNMTFHYTTLHYFFYTSLHCNTKKAC